MSESAAALHSHVFLGEGHEKSERKTWIVIGLCTAMMVAEMVGGYLFGSIALIADGLHMSTHAGALLLAALAYSFARKHATDARFSFGTGKLGDLAGFTSAIVLAMIALLIGYEAIHRFFSPVQINFPQAISIACLGLAVNLTTAWILSGGGHRHGHGHGHSHGHGHGHAHEAHGRDETHRIMTSAGVLGLKIFEDGAPPRFRLRADAGSALEARPVLIEILRPDGSRQTFPMANRGEYLESVDVVPEPHAFKAHVTIDGQIYPVAFEEPEHVEGKAGRDNNMRAAIIHIAADAAVSVLVILGLTLARAFDWLWMDPLVGIVGALVISSWALGLVRDTGAILLDMIPDAGMSEKLRLTIESEGDKVVDLHLWRLGPGHLGVIMSIVTATQRGADYYRARLARYRSLSHLTIEVRRAA